jgi:hypothetical protein
LYLELVLNFSLVISSVGGGREGRKVEALREKIQFKAAKEDHAR